jgi:hypothetical protein
MLKPFADLDTETGCQVPLPRDLIELTSELRRWVLAPSYQSLRAVDV